MKGSQELIAHYNKREAELEEKATKLNMFLEGYAVGYNDTKAFMIDKACQWLKEQLYTDDGGCLASEWYQQIDELIDGFRKTLEE